MAVSSASKGYGPTRGAMSRGEHDYEKRTGPEKETLHERAAGNSWRSEGCAGGHDQARRVKILIRVLGSSKGNTWPSESS